MLKDGYFGKYRGIVSDIKDPLHTGRIKVKVPDIYGDYESGWAMPCAPFGGKGSGLFILPTVGAGVWVEFECGDPDYPIWTGTWWGQASDLPDITKNTSSQKVIIRTEGGHSLILDDTPDSGGISLITSTGQKIILSSNGVEIDNGHGGNISITDNTVSINNGALEVQ